MIDSLLLTDPASVGFPGTLGFISTELLVDRAVEANLSVGGGVPVASARNGIAVVRADFRLFTGTRQVSAISVRTGPRERVSVITLSVLILDGGLHPQLGVTTRDRAAAEILRDRSARLGHDDHAPTVLDQGSTAKIKAADGRFGE